MSFPKNIAVYETEARVLHTASQSEKPLLVRCKSPKAAAHWRARVYYYRSLLRGQTSGMTPYDDLILTVSGSIVKISKTRDEIEIISDHNLLEAPGAIEQEVFEISGQFSDEFVELDK